MIETPDLKDVFGLGVAGNFAGHLEQAGQAVDFAAVEREAEQAPAGIFPWYVPGADSFLGTFPLTDGTLRVAGHDAARMQIEPEAGVLCRIAYSGDRVIALEPFAFGAFNDFSDRREDVEKLSEKKNWGQGSKGFASRVFAAERLPETSYRLACFLGRDGELHEYGVDSALVDYSYYGERLLDWIVRQLNEQQGAPGTPLEPVGEYLRESGADTMLVGIGAPRYTDIGQSTFLEPGDESIVAVYDAAVTSPADLRAALEQGEEPEATSVLRQVVAESLVPSV